MTVLADAEVLTRRNPFTGEVVATAPVMDDGQVAEAVGRAQRAGDAWAAHPVEERARVLRRFADLVDQRAVGLAALLVAEVGKVRAEAQGEVTWTAQSARWYADNPPRDVRSGTALVRRRPLGVVAVVTPWNVPLHTPAWKWLPALMAGNTVVWKGSELTPGTSAAAAALMVEAGLPDGVLELVSGDGGTGQAVVADPRVAGVHFTGSTATGRQVAVAAGSRFLPCALEMGGLNPVVVCADADLDRAAHCVVDAAVSINGQKCTATRRVLVDAAVADELGDRLRELFGGLVVGDPAAPGTDVGPLVTAAAATRARAAVDAALARGARVLARSVAPDDERFVAPVLLTDVAADDPLRREELFAPVVSLQTFTTTEQAWRDAGDTTYGLSAAVHTRDPETAREATDRLRAGVIAVNRRGDAVDLEAPFGGVGDSGNGHPEGGTWTYAALTRLQAQYDDDGLASP